MRSLPLFLPLSYVIPFPYCAEMVFPWLWPDRFLDAGMCQSVIITYEVYKGLWLKGPRLKQPFSGQMVHLVTQFFPREASCTLVLFIEGVAFKLLNWTSGVWQWCGQWEVMEPKIHSVDSSWGLAVDVDHDEFHSQRSSVGEPQNRAKATLRRLKVWDLVTQNYDSRIYPSTPCSTTELHKKVSWPDNSIG